MFTETEIVKLIFVMEIGSYFQTAGLHYQLLEKSSSPNDNCTVYEFERKKVCKLPAYFFARVCERVV